VMDLDRPGGVAKHRGSELCVTQIIGPVVDVTITHRPLLHQGPITVAQAMMLGWCLIRLNRSSIQWFAAGSRSWCAWFGLSLELSEELRWDGSSQCAGSPY
jgi:hypothetical protein